MPGTYIPGLIRAGSYLTPRGWEFWYVIRKRPEYVTIELKGGRYQRLILSPSDGDVWVERTNAAMSRMPR